MRAHSIIAALPLPAAAILMIAWFLMVHPVAEALPNTSSLASGADSQRNQSSKVGVEDPQRGEGIQRMSSGMDHTTFIRRLELAPYPYSGKYEDTDVDFFDYSDPQTGERFHTNRYGERFSEKDHYTDGSVLFHIPPHFRPDEPFSYVVFFHALQTDILASNRAHLFDRQMDHSGKNVILVMPQLARNATDSSPGKFFRRNAFRSFMNEVAEVLSQMMGTEYRDKLKAAPVILSAFSGGYKAAAYVLDRGGVGPRVIGVVLMDALYEDVDKFQKWIVENIENAFFVSIFTKGSCEQHSRELAFQLGRHGILAQTEWPRRITRGTAHFIFTPTDHKQIPLLGPPEEPLANVLRRMEAPSP